MKSLIAIFIGLTLSTPILGKPAPYEKYILAPTSRTIHPATIHKVNGTVRSPSSLTRPNSRGRATFLGDSAVTLDFGKNIGGFANVRFGANRGTSCIGVTFSESSLWINGNASDATADAGLDEALWFCPKDAVRDGIVRADRDHDRGSFRYMSLVRNGTGSTEITEVWTHFTPMPHIADDALGDYSGHFFSSDEKLNRVWYAGVYTTQVDTIDPTTGNALIWLGIINNGDNITEPIPWFNNATISNGTSVLTDGSKRDRLVWPGDMAITVPVVAVSTRDLVSLRTALDSLMVLQDPDGRLPYAGTPFHQTIPVFSATYHLYSLIGIANYYHFSGDADFVESYWDQFTLALEFSLSSVDDSGLMNVTSPADWLRFGMGGHNIEANAILYYTLNQAITLAQVVGDDSRVDSWTSIAENIKAAANSLLWSETTGLYFDNETTTLSPQDGNSWAIKANLTDSAEKAASISANLQERWTPFGAPAPEAADAISPFISGYELEAHFLASRPQRAIDLIRFMWADFMLDDPRMTNSTFIEGYSTTGNLHYPPYSNDPRISHCHGWATGPTSVLTFYVAGIQLLTANGQQWLIAPQFADLKHAEAGFETALGRFESAWSVEGRKVTLSFSTPRGTSGGVRLTVPFCAGRDARWTQNSGGSRIFKTQDGILEVGSLKGGSFKVVVDCA